MSRSHRKTSRRVLAAAATGILVAAFGTSNLVAHAQPAHKASAAPHLKSHGAATYKAGRYIVIMKGKPAAVYNGGVHGLRSSAAKSGHTFNSVSPAAKAYTAHLKSQQNDLAKSVGVKPYYNYTTALNGFAAHMTGRQAFQLSKAPGVLTVQRDKIVHGDDIVDTPTYLGLTGPAGLWRRFPGYDNPVSGAGKGMIIGVVDSGINPNSSSFAEVGDGVPSDWHGICDPGEDDSFHCNDKLIGGRYFDAGADIEPNEFLSPRDLNGHGTHTASTAAGEYGIESNIFGVDYGTIGGMAPAAKVAAYKALWNNPVTDGSNGSSSDIAAAIDAAVSDGVNVINMSISGTTTNVIDVIELATMYAADAGVFVANSGGNSGPTVSTVEHPSPWVTTVAASTYFNAESTVVLGNGDSYIGSSLAVDSVNDAPLVYAGDIPADGADPAEAALCFPDTLDADAADGKIVICDRGTNARTEKAEVAADAGAVGTILINTSPIGTVADVCVIPQVHLESDTHDAVVAYSRTDGATASILAGDDTGSTTADPPAIADFSSRGPSLAAGGDLLKPDISAPGVDVDAATAPEGPIGNGNDFGIISGTSMASPHIAGLAALIMQKHPDWSVMEVKSAMMTTANDLTDTQNPFDQGAGQINPQDFMDPGLAYDSDFRDWANYLAGQGVTYNGHPFTNSPIRASNVNLASIAVNDLAGREIVVRTVTNVGKRTATYNATVTGLDGITTTVTPSTLTLHPGETGTFRVKFVEDDAPLGEYANGDLVWSDGSHVVRSPIVVSPTGVAAPAEISTNGSNTTVGVKAGFNGTMGHRVAGLVAGQDFDGTATEDTSGSPLDDANFFKFIHVGGPKVVLRLDTIPSDPADDLDLYLIDANTGATVASSASGSAFEEITTSGLSAGDYYAVVQAFAVADGGDTTDFTLRQFKVTGADAGNLTVTPATQSVKPGNSYTWTVKATGLTAGTPYLGVIWWTQVANGPDPVIGSTLVDAEKPAKH